MYCVCGEWYRTGLSPVHKILPHEGLLTSEESMELSVKVWGIEKFEKHKED